MISHIINKFKDIFDNNLNNKRENNYKIKELIKIN